MKPNQLRQHKGFHLGFVCANPVHHSAGDKVGLHNGDLKVANCAHIHTPVCQPTLLALCIKAHNFCVEYNRGHYP